MEVAEGVQTSSYNNVVSNEQPGARSNQLLFEQRFDKAMDVEAETSNPKVTCIWEMGK